MSASTVTMTRVVCDSCRTPRDSLAKGTTAARIEAAAEGWKYVEYEIAGKGLQRYAREPGQPSKTVPRHWDSCPACPLPSLEEAIAIVEQRRAA